MPCFRHAFASALTLLLAAPVAAQTPARPDSVLQRIWDAGMRDSHIPRLAQTLLDSIGPRLAGSPQEKAGHDWLEATYRSWSIPVRSEKYGTWKGWRRGTTHVDLIQPRVRTLEAMLLAWSSGTRGPINTPVVTLPDVRDSAAFAAWLPTARGKAVLISTPEPTCRPDESWEESGLRQTVAGMRRERDMVDSLWTLRIKAAGGSRQAVAERLERAGVAAILSSRWSGGWGTTTVTDTPSPSSRVPALVLGCEDYGLVFRLAENEQGAVLRIDARADDLGEVPVLNTIAELPGREQPDEYVLLSAHFDSWDGGSGATDNGTGTLIMMEAMRLLRIAYPHPRRTILVGHWGGEERGHNGSRSFAEGHPEIVRGIHAGFNHDYGTGRIVRIALEGFADAGPHAARWISRLPLELTDSLTLENPGLPGPGGSDYLTFNCRGVPVFNLISVDWNYDTYTWHTNRDTFDKLSFDDLRRSATLVAMLAYQAAEDPQKMSREQRTVFPMEPGTGEHGTWPACEAPRRSWADFLRTR